MAIDLSGLNDHCWHPTGDTQIGLWSGDLVICCFCGKRGRFIYKPRPSHGEYDPEKTLSQYPVFGLESDRIIPDRCEKRVLQAR